MGDGGQFVALGVDVRLLTFDDAVPKDLPDWFTQRLVLIPRLGFWMTYDETRGAEEQTVVGFRWMGRRPSP